MTVSGSLEVLHVAIDDADSHEGGCTTYVAWSIMRELLRSGARLVGLPRLIRLNPYVPFKTRGNAAVAFTVAVKDAGDARELVLKMLWDLAEKRGKASPGAAFVVGQVPSGARRVYRLALSQVVPRDLALGAGVYAVGGRGVVGAVAALGAELPEATFELLVYRDTTVDRPRIPTSLVKLIDELTKPLTFGNLAGDKALIQPTGPDPVLYGVRGVSIPHLLWAKQLLDANGFSGVGWAVYATNQGTDAHIRFGEVPREPRPYSAYVAEGIIVEARRVEHRHVTARLHWGLGIFAYRHLGKLATELETCVGCRVVVAGGLKPRMGELWLYVEKLLIVDDLARTARVKPRCPVCGGSMESLGRRGGLRCRRCGYVMRAGPATVYAGDPRRWGLKTPPPNEWRHLFKPPSLYGLEEVAKAQLINPPCSPCIG